MILYVDLLTLVPNARVINKTFYYTGFHYSLFFVLFLLILIRKRIFEDLITNYYLQSIY